MEEPDVPGSRPAEAQPAEAQPAEAQPAEAQPDKAQPDAGRRRRPWLVEVAVAAAVVAVLATVGLTVMFRRPHRIVFPDMTVQVAVTTDGFPTVFPEGYDYRIDGDQILLWLPVRAGGTPQLTLQRATVDPSDGVTVLATGFAADGDTSGRTSPSRVVRAGDLAEVVIRYRVDCAAVRSPWPYLGTVSVLLTGGAAPVTMPLTPPPSGPAAPAPPPCPAPTG